jgi:two-component system sensor histidine kinase BaeS
VKPIRELTVAAQTASGAELPRVPVRAGDEIGDLASAFNALGERLMRSEAARRDLVSDVAHELRTPLTNVRCALEAFQDGIDEPSPQALRSVLADVLLRQRLGRRNHSRPR